MNGMDRTTRARTCLHTGRSIPVMTIASRHLICWNERVSCARVTDKDWS